MRLHPPIRGWRYHPLVAQPVPTLQLDLTYLRPGIRLGVGVSGGADSVALLRELHTRGRELGLALHVAHLHHGLRGAEADADLEFVRDLAVQLDLPFHSARMDTAAEAEARPDKPGETIEEAARRLRYSWFRSLMAELPLDAVATAHTLDDQAETVLAKFLRGAWTEGLSGIHPSVQFAEGQILRPLLKTTRGQIEHSLQEIGQGWREDSSNRHLTFTRNRIRHELLPMLESWNPRLREHLAQMAELARDEQASWQAEVERIMPLTQLPGKPVRGGGRAAAEGIALDLTRLVELSPALQRRVLRQTVEQLGMSADFQATEAVRRLMSMGRAGQRCELAMGLRAERTHRELRLSLAPIQHEEAVEAIALPVPGVVDAPSYGFCFRIEADQAEPQRLATLRTWKAGDRVVLQHSSGPRKVKEVLERLKVSGAARARWPVLELDERIVWMKGVTVEQSPGIRVTAIPLQG